MKENKIKIRLRLVIIKNNKLLGYFDSIEDYYFFVGGKMEFGETVEECCHREIKEELGEDVKFTFKKILYIRDFILPNENEHSLELYILGDIDKFEGINYRPDQEFAGKKWPIWLDIDNLPTNIRPHNLTVKIISDYKKDFPNSGEYVGKIDC